MNRSSTSLTSLAATAIPFVGLGASTSERGLIVAWRGYRLLALAVSALVICLGCGRFGRSVPTVDGPESNDLLPSVEGYLVQAPPRGELVAVQLPSLKKAVVRPPAPSQQEMDFPVIHAVSGPDSDARIAYIEDWFFVTDEKDQRHLLKSVKIDGADDSVVFSRRGSAMWADSPAGGGEIGSQLSLAPVGGRVAFISDLSGVQMENPSAGLSVGSLEVWDTTKKTGRKLDVTALDTAVPSASQLSWFPDGKSLAYVELVRRTSSESQLDAADEFGGSFRGWDQVPAAHVLDIETGRTRFVHIGWNPIVSSDGKWMFVLDRDNKCRLVEMATGKSKPVKLPGITFPGLVAHPEPGKALYWGMGTTGSPVKYTHLGRRGPQPLLTIKLGETETGKFQTVLPHADPRSPLSFGPAKLSD